MFDHRFLQFTAIQALVICAPLGGTASAVHAASAQDPAIIRADEVTWKPAPSSLDGVQMAVLQGDPAVAGPFVMRLKFPAFFDFPVHRHPAIAADITVLSGAMGLALGKTFDQYVASPLPAGSHVVIPDTWHFAWTFEETVIEVHGNGPWRVEYLEP